MSGARVLVVDDERFFREAISEVLEREGVPFALAEGGEDALAAGADAEVGVVILDLNLPDLHGLEVFRRLRERRPELRVVILSASTDEEHVLEALRLGAFDYLAKPLHEEELALAVARARDAFASAAGLRRLRAGLGRLESAFARVAAAAEEGGAEAVAEAAVAAAGALLGAERTSLVRMGDGAAEGRVVACRGTQQPPEALDPVRPGEGPAGLVLARGDALRVEDAAADARFAGRAPEGRYRSGSFVLAPVRAKGRTTGVLCATEPADGGVFDEEALALLRLLAEQVAAAEALAQSPPAEPAEGEPAEAEPGEGEAARSELMREICAAVTEEVEPARVLRAALRATARALGAAPASIHLRDPESGELAREAEEDGARRVDRERLPAGRGLTGVVLESGQLVATPDPAADPRFDAEVDTPADAAAGPLLCGPLRFRGRALGIFRVFPEDPLRATPRTAELLAAALSAAVRSALLYRSLVETIEEVAEARRSAQGAAAPGRERGARTAPPPPSPPLGGAGTG